MFLRKLRPASQSSIREFTTNPINLQVGLLNQRNKHEKFLKLLTRVNEMDRLPLVTKFFSETVMTAQEKIYLLLLTATILKDGDALFLLAKQMFSPAVSMQDYILIVDNIFPCKDDDYQSAELFELDARLIMAKLMSPHLTNVSELIALLRQIHPADRFEFSLSHLDKLKNMTDAFRVFDSMFEARKYACGKHFIVMETSKLPGGVGDDDRLERLVFMKAIIAHIAPQNLFMAVSRLAPVHRAEFKELFLKDKQPEERSQILFALSQHENSTLVRMAQAHSHQLFNKTYAERLNKALEDAAEKQVNVVSKKM